MRSNPSRGTGRAAIGAAPAIPRGRRERLHMTIIAIMQPYFVPYAGYFRLFQVADVFVAYDCVQFPRRGYVHRNKLTDWQGTSHYLTLPLAPAPRKTRIDELRFRARAGTEMAQKMRRFPVLQRAPAADPLMAWLHDLDRPVADYLIDGLDHCAQRLGVARPVRRSSALGLPAELRGQERILAVAEAFGADAYVNAPGGRNLYDAKAFRTRGIKLGFLAPFEGGKASVLERLLADGGGGVAAEVKRASRVDWITG